MPSRPCLECGGLFTPGGGLTSRCRIHTRARQRATTRVKRARRPYTAAERTRRAAAVAEHRANYGDVCPGWQRPPHPARDLTADHVLPVAAGGAEHGPLSVLCRKCNSAKRATVGDAG
jgi:5-methylcytosine-specific restriction protein A